VLKKQKENDTFNKTVYEKLVTAVSENVTGELYIKTEPLFCIIKQLTFHLSL